jgi:DNA-binding LacI/PurR family transcriptional regulator
MKIADIAREAGVSNSTVSFYINGHSKKYKISEKTCQKIEEVIRKHNFVPNIYARAMQTHQTFLIGLIIPGDVNRSYWIDVISGAEEALFPHKYHLLLSVSHFNQEDELETVKFMHSKGVDGYLYAPLVPDSGVTPAEKFLLSRSEKKPVISLGREHRIFPSVCNDDYAGGEAAARCFLEHGHRRAAYIGHYRQKHDLRGKAFCECFRNGGGEIQVFESTDAALEEARNFSCVFCFSDYFLLDFYVKAGRRGVRIPEDLSVIGYDHMSFLEFLQPQPVSLITTKKELGRAAGEMMMQLLAQPEEKIQSRKFIPELSPGDSVRSVC